eukprot:2749810-Karenia_brevis.AAC.1
MREKAAVKMTTLQDPKNTFTKCYVNGEHDDGDDDDDDDDDCYLKASWGRFGAILSSFGPKLIHLGN